MRPFVVSTPPSLLCIPRTPLGLVIECDSLSTSDSISVRRSYRLSYILCIRKAQLHAPPVRPARPIAVCVTSVALSATLHYVAAECIIVLRTSESVWSHPTVRLSRADRALLHIKCEVPASWCALAPSKRLSSPCNETSRSWQTTSMLFYLNMQVDPSGTEFSSASVFASALHPSPTKQLLHAQLPCPDEYFRPAMWFHHLGAKRPSRAPISTS